MVDCTETECGYDFNFFYFSSSFVKFIIYLYVLFCILQGHKNTSYPVFKCADNSEIAEHDGNQRQYVCDEENRRHNGYLNGVAAVGAPWHTSSTDDVRAKRPSGRHVHWNEDPHEHNCQVLCTLLHVQLQNARVAF